MYRITQVLVAALLFSACIPGHQHLYNGEILPKGKESTQWALSFPEKYYLISKYDTLSINADQKKIIRENCENLDSNCVFEQKSKWIASRTARLGVFDSLGPLPGLEVGYQLQSTLGLGFFTRLGLPSPLSSIKHAWGAGWDLGSWTDNTWWTDYTLSWHHQNWTMILQNRASRWATANADANENFTRELGTWHMYSALYAEINGSTEGAWPQKWTFGLSNSWQNQVYMEGSQSHSRAYFHRSESWGINPTFAVGLTWQ